MGTSTHKESQNQMPEGESKLPSLGVPKPTTLILKKLFVKQKNQLLTSIPQIFSI